MIEQDTLLNFVGGQWEAASAGEHDRRSTIRRPARCWPPRRCRRPPTSPRPSQAASKALPAWRRTPPGDRIQPLFRLKALLDAQLHRDRAS